MEEKEAVRGQRVCVCVCGGVCVGATSKGLLLEMKICLGHRGTHFPWR